MSSLHGKITIELSEKKKHFLDRIERICELVLWIDLVSLLIAFIYMFIKDKIAIWLYLACLFLGLLTITASRVLNLKRNKIITQIMILKAFKDLRSPFLILHPFSHESINFKPDIVLNRNRVIGSSYLNEIAEALEPEGQPIVIGRVDPADLFIKTHILYLHSDSNDWFNLFKLLVDSCRCIFVLPGISPGIGKEIEYLTNSEYITKLVFVMPPDIRRTFVSTKVDENFMNKQWDLLKEQWKKVNIHFPDYMPEGCLFRLNPFLYTTLNKDNHPSSWKQTINSFSIPNEGIPISEIAPKFDLQNNPFIFNKWDVFLGHYN